MATEITSQMGPLAPLTGGLRVPPVVPEKTEPAAGREAEGHERAAKAPEAAGPGTTEQLREAVVHLNQLPQVVNRDLMFVVDEESGSLVVKVVNSDTEELIRQMPPEEALHRAKFLEDVEGLIFRSKA